MNRNLSSEAIVLYTKSFSEADKLITVYSKNFGKLTLIAKGVKKLKSRKRGSLEPFSIIKFSAIKVHGMPIMTEAEVLDNLSEFRTSLQKVSVAYFFVEVVYRSTQDEEPHIQIFDLLRKSLNRLKSEDKLKNLRREFSVELGEILGFIPEGQFVPNVDEMIEAIIERKLGSVRVGKRLQL